MLFLCFFRGRYPVTGLHATVVCASFISWLHTQKVPSQPCHWFIYKVLPRTYETTVCRKWVASEKLITRLHYNTGHIQWRSWNSRLRPFFNILNLITLQFCCFECQINRGTEYDIILNIKIITNKYEGKSVYKSQMDVKRKTRYSNLGEKHLFLDISSTNTDILAHRFTSASKQSFDCFISHSHTSVSIASSARLLPLSGKHFRKISLRISFALCPLCSQKTHNRTLLFDSTLLKHSCHFDYWNQPLNMRMHVCYVDCHGVRLCCWLVIYIENQLRPLQLFYFHLWVIYRLSLVILIITCRGT
jgi:hypothetical protein